MIAKDKDISIGELYSEDLKNTFADLCSHDIKDPSISSFELVMLNPKLTFLNIKLTESGLSKFPVTQ